MVGRLLSNGLCPVADEQLMQHHQQMKMTCGILLLAGSRIHATNHFVMQRSGQLFLFWSIEFKDFFFELSLNYPCFC